MNTRLIPVLALAGVLAGLAITTAGATVHKVGSAPSVGAAAARPPDTDTDGDKVFENLSARLETLEADERLSVIVRLTGDLTNARADAVERAVGGFELTRWLPIVDGFAATMTKTQVQELARLTGVASVEENGVVRALNDSAQASFGVTKARTDIPGLDGNTDGNLATYSKDDLVVAVIDSGIDASHPQLDDGKVLAFANCLNQPTPSTCSRPAPFDDDDHGTHVAATIVGDGEGDTRYKGVAPGAALVGVKVLAAPGGSNSEAGLVSGIQWVVQNKATYGIEVINLSVGGGLCSHGTDSMAVAAEAAVTAGLVVLVAGGNSGPGPCTILSPGAAPNVITVGAMADTGVSLAPATDDDWLPGFNLAKFSSRGPTGDGRIKPDIVAPGVQITSANASNAHGGATPYLTWDGTSMATPFVAGVALLMLEANPALTHAQIKSTLMSTALDWGRGGSFHDPGTSGADVDYGAGRLDAFAAIKAAGAPLGTAPEVPEHTLLAGSLAGTGLWREHKVIVTNTSFPLAATLVMPRWSASNPNFNLKLYGPSGGLIAESTSPLRQDQLGAVVTQTGTYTLLVNSVSGAGGYVLDVSGAAPGPPPTAPSAPTGVSATAEIGGGEAWVRWAAPASHGGETITNYVVTPYVGTTAQPATTVNGLNRTVRFTGLTNGTTYTFKVRARNGVGDGPDSTSNPVTPQVLASTAARWPMYGHDPAHTGRAAADGPSDLTPAWSLPLGQTTEANNSPVVGPDGSIYVTTSSKVFAVNPDGTVRCEAFALSSAAPSVSTDGGAVYVPGSTGLTRMSAATCETVWNRGEGITSSSPTVGPDGTIYFGSGSDTSSQGSLYALNPDGTTKCVWTPPGEFPPPIESSPAIGPNGEIYFVRLDFSELTLVALDANCQLDWSRSGIGYPANTPSVGPDGTVYIGNWDGLYALNPADGSTKDGWPVAVDSFEAMAKASASISQDGSRLYRGDDGGGFHAFNNDTASVACSYNTGAGGIYSAPALAANNVVYFTKAAANAKLYALKASDCTLVDTYAIGHSESSPAFGSDGTLYALGDDATGKGVLYAFRPAQDATAPADFDGDGDTDFSVWRPQTGTWYAFGGLTQQWGVSSDVPVPGQYDGDPATDVAVWRPSTGTWYVHGGATQQWGVSTDVPVPGDYNGDGDTDIAVWRPSTGTWYVQGGATQQWGVSTDVPVPADYDGDGDTDIAVWRPATGTWYVQGGATQQWGVSSDIPVPGQYDADPATEIAVWRPSTGTWYVQGGATQQWGVSSDIPVPGQYDADPATEMAVWRPSTGTWYVQGGATQQWGVSSDRPLPVSPAIARLLFS